MENKWCEERRKNLQPNKKMYSTNTKKRYKHVDNDKSINKKKTLKHKNLYFNR